MKKSVIIGLNLIFLLGLSGCGNNPAPASSSNSSEVSEPSVPSETPSSDPSVEPSSEPSVSPSSEDDESEHDYSEDPEPDPTEVSVAEALSIIDGLDANKRTLEKYSITGYIKTITGEYDPYRYYLSFTLADSMDSDVTILSYRTFAESEITAQEFVPGAKFNLIGQLVKSVSDDVTEPMMPSPEAVLVESVLATATSMSMDSAISVSVDQKVALEVSWEPSNARKEAITWSVEDESVASVEAGVVTGLANGTTKVIASTENFRAECVVTVAEDSNYVTVGLNKYVGDAPTTAVKAEYIVDWAVVDNGGIIDSCTAAENVFVQPGCIRLGNSQKPGSVSFSLKEAMKVSKVVISAKTYNTDAGAVNFAAEGFSGTITPVVPSSKMEFVNIEYDLGESTITSFTISNSLKRTFIESVSFVLAA